MREQLSAVLAESGESQRPRLTAQEVAALPVPESYRAAVPPTLSRVYPLQEVGQAAYDVHRNLHHGKVGVLALASQEGLGVRDAELRARHRHAINRFRTGTGPV